MFRFQAEHSSAWLAQLVEQRTENPRVSGSIPEPGILKKNKTEVVLLRDTTRVISLQDTTEYAGVVQW